MAKQTVKKAKKEKDVFSLCDGLQIDAAKLNRVVEKNNNSINKVLKKSGQLELPTQSLFSKKDNDKGTKDAKGKVKQVNDKLLFKNMEELGGKGSERLLMSVKGSLNMILSGKA